MWGKGFGFQFWMELNAENIILSNNCAMLSAIIKTSETIIFIMANKFE